MDSTNNEDLTTPPTQQEDSLPFEYVTRKRKGKKRGKAVSLSYFNRNKWNEPQSSAGSSTNISQETSDNDEPSTNSNVIYGVKYEGCAQSIENEETEAFTTGNSRITLDGQMNAPPVITTTPTHEINEYAFETKEHSPKEEAELIEDLPVPLMTYNTRALPKNSVTYELEKFHKNAMLIFNQKNINGYKPRLGTEKDEEELIKTFSSFGFEVSKENDLTKEEIMQKLQEFSDQDYTDYGCVVVAVLTHGSKHGLIRAKDQQYSELEIIKHFKVDRRPTLVTKPKILIIQACRGSEDITGVTVYQAMGKIQKDFDDEVEPYTLPVESDMLILHSSYIGKPSHRDELLGSWFIQSLCSKINGLAATHDLESILTEVKRDVAIDKSYEEHNRRTFQTNINKQMPVTTSTLIRKLYLKKFGDAPPTPAVHSLPDEARMNDNCVLDNGSPSSPLYDQYGPCTCFLPHFEYMKECLKHYLDDYPEDHTAKAFYDVASAFEQKEEFNSAKKKMLAAISQHLSSSRAANSAYYKFLYLYMKNY